MRFIYHIYLSSVFFFLAGCATPRLSVYDFDTKKPVENAFVYINENKMFNPFNGSNLYLTDEQGNVNISESLKDGQVSVFVGKEGYDLNETASNITRLILLRWDTNISAYKAALDFRLENGTFSGENAIGDDLRVEYNGSFNSDILKIELICFNKINNNYIKIYEINTRIKVQNEQTNILGWSASTSDNNFIPEFICFAMRPRPENTAEFTMAASLASEFLAKLEQDTPFTIKEGEKFFGPIAPIPSLNVFLLQKLGYLNGAGTQIKPLPKYSPLGELFRMNRALFLPEWKAAPRFYSAREFINDSKNKFAICNKNAIFVYVKMFDMDGGIISSNEKLICFDYNTNGFFFVWGFSVNGKSILKDLGFYTKKHDKYNYPVIEIQDGVLKALKARLEQLK